jgi:hypothetical protein
MVLGQRAASKTPDFRAFGRERRGWVASGTAIYGQAIFIDP